MRNLLKTTISLLALVSFLGLTSSAFGVASFARQTGLDCSSCHAATGFPALNSFGAAFKAGGYVQGNEANMIGDGDALSIPATLNMSIVTKLMAKYKTVTEDNNGTETKYSYGEWAFPDEAAIFLGGRIGKNTGFVLEHGDAHFNSFKIVTTMDIGGGKLGIVPWLTDAFGPAWVFEVLSTGAVRNIRDAEDRSAQSAAQKLGYAGASGDTSGLGLYYWTSMFHVAYSAFTNGLEGTRGGGTKFAHYVRAAVTPNVAGFDMGLGVQLYTGAAEADTGAKSGAASHGIGYTYDMLAVDYQLMGNAGSMPMLFTLTYASMGGDKAACDTRIDDGDGICNATDTYPDNTFDATTGELDSPTKISALGIGFDIGVLPDKLGVMLGYTMLLGPAELKYGTTTVTNDGNTELMVGLKYNVHRNYRLQAEYTMLSEGTSVGSISSSTKTGQMMVMVFGSF